MVSSKWPRCWFFLSDGRRLHGLLPTCNICSNSRVREYVMIIWCRGNLQYANSLPPMTGLCTLTSWARIFGLSFRLLFTSCNFVAVKKCRQKSPRLKMWDQNCGKGITPKGNGSLLLGLLYFLLAEHWLEGLKSSNRIDVFGLAKGEGEFIRHGE